MFTSGVDGAGRGGGVVRLVVGGEGGVDGAGRGGGVVRLVVGGGGGGGVVFGVVVIVGGTL
ncbi:MAG: hypothetical protein ACRC41_12880 [Sarcina sp.]